MKIRTQFIVSMLFFGLILITIAASLAATNEQVARYNQQEVIANNIERSAQELSYISNSYLLYGESQLRTRWESTFAALSADLSRLGEVGPEEQITVNNIKANMERLKTVFTEVVAAIESKPQTPGSFFDPAFIQVSWSRMEVQSQGIIFDASRLFRMFDDGMDQARQTNTILIAILVGIFGIYLLLNYMLVYRRTLKSVEKLRVGTEIIGAGNLGYTMVEKSKDEIGELAHAFNRMTANLKDVTASKTELEREIAERQNAKEDLLQRSRETSALLEAARTVLKIKEFKDAARAIFNNCKELIGATSGYVALLSKDGAENEVLFLDSGGRPCTVDPSLPMPIRGLRSEAYRTGKVVYENDFARSDWAKLMPAGHVALENVIFSPLVIDGKAVGLLGLANKPGEFTENDAKMAAAFGGLAAISLQNSQMLESLESSEHALRETSDYLNNLLDYANAPIIVWDPDFTITRFNHAFERLTGLGAGEVLGKPLDILFPEKSKAESLDFIHKAVAGERWEVVEIPILRKDGTVRTVLWNSANLHAPDDETVIATIAQGQDITERKQAEDEIRRLNEGLKQHAAELEAANYELESFSYSASHDLRAPLRSMEGFSQALLEDYADRLDAVGKDYLKRVQDSSQLMAQLIDDLLKLSKVTRSEMQREDVDLSELARLIVHDLSTAEPERKVKITIAPGMQTSGDAKLLRVALENLIGNAWKFTSKTPQTKIEVGKTERDGKIAYFVRDNGAGFDMTYAGKLFAPFQRLHKTNEFPGTGIGLATVQRIIHRHSGKIWPEAEVGKGATFYFIIS